MRYTGQLFKAPRRSSAADWSRLLVDDVQLPDMLYAYVLRSPHAHARIKSIDVEAARQLPGVVAVIPGADIAAR